MGKQYDISVYNEKRNFSRTSKPKGQKGMASEMPRFSFQMHDASQLHFDFRLEVNGVLKSWAVPKGPSTDKCQKRLAIRTEDHPLGYIDFAGIIPENAYGGGTVLVWDIGTYDNITEKDGKIRDMEESIEKGHFLIRLNGKKLKGNYAMTRINNKEGQWLLVKMDDEYADARRKPAKTQQVSAITGKDLAEIKKEAKSDPEP